LGILYQEIFNVKILRKVSSSVMQRSIAQLKEAIACVLVVRSYFMEQTMVVMSLIIRMIMSRLMLTQVAPLLAQIVTLVVIHYLQLPRHAFVS
jgi:hypothetical protein